MISSPWMQARVLVALAVALAVVKHLPAATPMDSAGEQGSTRLAPAVVSKVLKQREQRYAVTPNDVRFGAQWWLQAALAGNTGAAGFTQAWDRSTGAPATGLPAVVAVLDSGITSHPELNARLLPGYDFVSDTTYANDGNGRDNDPADPGDAIPDAERIANPVAYGGCPPAPLSSWHGTLIAGQLAAVSNNTEGVAAGNWNTRVLPVRVAGRCGAALGDIIDALRWAAGLVVAGVPVNPNPARVIVLSYGGADPCDVASATPEIAAAARLYTDTIAAVRAAGALVVVAAGNQRSVVGRPAGCPGAFGVASLNREGFKAAYSNLGAAIALATPGGDAGDGGVAGGTCDAQLADTGVVSTSNLGDVTPAAAGYAAASGTSFAAPAVAAVATLMLAVNPALTVADLDAGLRQSAKPHVRVPLLGACAASGNFNGRCECGPTSCGAGMLDADEALRYAAAPRAYAAPLREPVTLADARIRACAVLLGRPMPDDPPPPPQPPPPPPAEPPPAAGGAGGGAVAGIWALLLMLAAAALLPSPVRAEGSALQTIRKNLRARMPHWPAIDEVRRTPLPGIYEVRMGHELMYSDAGGNFVLNGSLIDTRTRRNLTDARIEAITAIQFKALPWTDAIVFKQGDGSRRLAVFVDPLCGYCKQFERELAALPNVTIHTFLYPVLGAESQQRARAVWCAKDPAKAWRDWMLQGVVPVPVPVPAAEAGCDDSALARNQAFGQRHQILGTPASIFVDGSRLAGAVRGAELEQRLAAPRNAGG